MDNNKVTVVDTDSKKDNGTNRCPKCGAGEIIYDIKKEKLICNYCNTEFDSSDVSGVEKEVKSLKGEKRTTGTKDIKQSEDILTLKCDGCGAEVIINTNETMNARCHWCRSILSINSQIENGAVPDFVLPFKLEKQDAQSKIEEFVKKRRFFASSIFKKEFTTNNIMGVFFPYLLIDANCHAKFIGEGGHVARSYEIVVGKDKDGKEEKETVYDIDMYNIEREFDISIDDLSIESSRDKLNKRNKEKTTNIINSIMPFDTENCVKYEANYLVGYNSEKRDVNVDNLKNKVNQSLADIARYSINNDLKHYDSGIRWDDEKIDILGEQWSSSYLPVWLYSYQDKKKILHYVAVNGRTGETMGSVPINRCKLFLLSLLLFLIIFIIPSGILLVTGKFEYSNSRFIIVESCFSFIIALLISIFFYTSKTSKYRNKEVRHWYEMETRNNITNLKRKDEMEGTLRGRHYRLLSDANNDRIVGEYIDLKDDNEKEQKQNS